MRLTQATNYSIRVLLYCAVNPDRPSRVADIAATFDMSETHLFKILKVLVDHKFIETIRGRHGGLKLGRPAEEIKLGDVIAGETSTEELGETIIGPVRAYSAVFEPESSMRVDVEVS